MSKIILIALLALALVAVVQAQVAGGGQPGRDQQKAGLKHTAAMLKSLEVLNLGTDPISAQKIASLDAPKIEYYHEIQKTVDREVDLAARAVIKNPERDAWLKQQKDDIKFAKAVSEATSTLHAAEAKAPRGIVGAKIKF